MRPSGNSARAKVMRETKVFSAGDPMGMCKAGVEIHFKPIPNQTSKTTASLRRFKRDQQKKKPKKKNYCQAFLVRYHHHWGKRVAEI